MAHWRSWLSHLSSKQQDVSSNLSRVIIFFIISGLFGKVYRPNKKHTNNHNSKIVY